MNPCYINKGCLNVSCLNWAKETFLTWIHWLALFASADQAPRRFPTRARLRRPLFTPWSALNSLEAVRLESWIT